MTRETIFAMAAALAWQKGEIEPKEEAFLHRLGIDLQMDPAVTTRLYDAAMPGAGPSIDMTVSLPGTPDTGAQWRTAFAGPTGELPLVPPAQPGQVQLAGVTAGMGAAQATPAGPGLPHVPGMLQPGQGLAMPGAPPVAQAPPPTAHAPAASAGLDLASGAAAPPRPPPPAGPAAIGSEDPTASIPDVPIGPDPLDATPGYSDPRPASLRPPPEPEREEHLDLSSSVLARDADGVPIPRAIPSEALDLAKLKKEQEAADAIPAAPYDGPVWRAYFVGAFGVLMLFSSLAAIASGRAGQADALAPNLVAIVIGGYFAVSGGLMATRQPLLPLGGARRDPFAAACTIAALYLLLFAVSLVVVLTGGAGSDRVLLTRWKAELQRTRQHWELAHHQKAMDSLSSATGLADRLPEGEQRAAARGVTLHVRARLLIGLANLPAARDWSPSERAEKVQEIEDTFRRSLEVLGAVREANGSPYPAAARDFSEFLDSIGQGDEARRIRAEAGLQSEKR